MRQRDAARTLRGGRFCSLFWGTPIPPVGMESVPPERNAPFVRRATPRLSGTVEPYRNGGSVRRQTAGLSRRLYVLLRSPAPPVPGEAHTYAPTLPVCAIICHSRRKCKHFFHGAGKSKRFFTPDGKNTPRTYPSGARLNWKTSVPVCARIVRAARFFRTYPQSVRRRRPLLPHVSAFSPQVPLTSSARIRVLSASAAHFFCTYFRQSRVTAVRIMIPSNTNCRFVSMPRMVRE